FWSLADRQNVILCSYSSIAREESPRLPHKPDWCELSLLPPARSEKTIVLELSQIQCTLRSYGPRRSSISSGVTDLHVNIGVSMAVYLLASLLLSSITRLRKSSGRSVSKESTNSYSSKPKE